MSDSNNTNLNIEQIEKNVDPLAEEVKNDVLRPGPGVNSPARTMKTTSALTKSALGGLANASNNLPKPENAAPEKIVVMAKYTAYWANKKEEDKIYSVVVELPHLETVHEAIKDVIPLLNQKLEADKSPYALANDPTLFNLYKAKKTGHAKLDFPALDSTQILNQTGIQQISLHEKDPKAIVQRANGKVTAFIPPPKLQMLTPTLPANERTESSFIQTEDTIVESTCCFCFKFKKVVQKQNPNVSMQETNMRSNLMGNQL